MSDSHVTSLAREMLDAYNTGSFVPVPPSAREGGIDLDTGYAVEEELARMRGAAGHNVVGRKIGLANRAVWQAMKLRTLVWASMYDDTVHHAADGRGTWSVARMRAPRVEPEIVVRLKAAPRPGADAAGALEAVEWIALGFEFIDCPYPDWKFQPGDFLASLGLHAALVVGEPRPIGRDEIPALVDKLAAFTTRLSKDGQVVEEGGERTSSAARRSASRNFSRRFPRSPAPSRCARGNSSARERQRRRNPSPPANGGPWRSTVSICRPSPSTCVHNHGSPCGS